MSEKKSVPKLGENTKDFSANATTMGEIDASREHEQTRYRDMADILVRDHAGDVPAQDRDFLVNTVAAEVRQILTRTENLALASDSEDDIKRYKVKAMEDLIWKLRGDRDQQHSPDGALAENPADETPEQDVREEQGPRPEGVPTTEEVEQQAAEAERNKGKYGFRRIAKMGLGLVTLGAMSIGTRQNLFKRHKEESWEEYDKRTRKHAWIGAVGIGIAAAAATGWKLWAVKNGIEHSMNGQVYDPADQNKDGFFVDKHEREWADRLKAGDLNHDGALDGRENALLDGFGYNWDEDPFNDTNKQGVHNFGNELGAHTHGAEKAVGLDDLTENRWKDSPEQFATAAAEMGLDGFKTDNIEEMAEKLKADPEFYEKSHKQLMGILNNPDTKFSIGSLEPGTYGSYYETAVDENGVISYDNNIGEPGTTIKIDYKDAQGNWKTIEFKRECGGQVIHRNPIVEASAPVYNGQGNGNYVPDVPEGTGNGGNPPTPNNPPNNPPENPPNNPPTPNNPPENPPNNPPENPPNNPPEPKTPREDINVNPELPEQLQMGDDRVGPGEQKPATEPPATYNPPAAPETPAAPAPGATPNTRTPESSNPAPTIPAPEAPANGDNGGNSGDPGGF